MERIIVLLGETIYEVFWKKCVTKNLLRCKEVCHGEKNVCRECCGFGFRKVSLLSEESED